MPCQKTNFFIKDIGFKKDLVFSGVFIQFDNVVEKTVSELQFTAKTLVTRFGGFIGLSKNLLWLIILLVSSMGFLSTRVKEENRKRNK